MKTCEFKDQLDLNLILLQLSYRCAKVPGGIQSRKRRFLHMRPGESDPSHIPNCRVLHEINQNDPKLNNLQARFDIRSYR